MEKIKIIDPYQNYDSVLQQDANGVYGNDLLGRVQSLQVGFGSKVMRVDRDGLWLGSDHFSDAPFKVDMAGNITATTLSLDYVPLGGSLADIGIGNITGTYIASGSITTAKLTANAIDGMTITGSYIRTSSGSTRVELNNSTNSLRVLKSGTLRVSLDDDDLSFFNTSGNLLGFITTPTTTNLTMQATNGNFLILNAAGTSYSVNLRVGGNERLVVANNSISLRPGGSERFNVNTGDVDIFSELDMNNYRIRGIFDIILNARSIGSSTLSAGQIAYHSSGGVHGIRTRVGTFNGQVDLTAF